MRTPDLRSAVDTLASLKEDKRQNKKKQQASIGTINRAFRHIGYHLTKATVKDGEKRRGRPSTKTQKLRLHESNGVAEVVKRKPGRPRVSKPA